MPRGADPFRQTLTERELEIVMACFADDEPTQAVVGERLGITRRGVEAAVQRIYLKLGVRTMLGVYRKLNG